VPASDATGIPPLPTLVLGSHGYQPAPKDEELLTRLLYAEGRNTPDDLPAIAWSTVNRIGDPMFGKTLDQVAGQHKAFQSMPNGGGAAGGSSGWRDSADPSKLTGLDAKAWRQAQAAAHGVLTGAIPDPTGGAQYFMSSRDVSGDASKAVTEYQWFNDRFTKGKIASSQYQGHIGKDEDGLHRNYFFVVIQDPRDRLEYETGR
jgi:hypothetical protein